MIWVGAIVVVMIGAALALQRRLIYLPTDDVAPIETVLPGWIEAPVTTTDGLELRLWFWAPPPGAPVVIVFPGNAGNRSDRAPLGQRLAQSGVGVILTDYRGYGRNPGSPTEEGLQYDARAAAAFAAEEAPGHPVVYFGESLGAAVAIELATEQPPATLILRSPFLSLAAVAGHHYPLLPVGALLRDRYPSDERIGGLESPTLVIYGTADTIVPADQSRTLAGLIRAPVRTLAIEDADHNDMALLAGDQLISDVLGFIGDVTAGQSG